MVRMLDILAEYLQLRHFLFQVGNQISGCVSNEYLKSDTHRPVSLRPRLAVKFTPIITFNQFAMFCLFLQKAAYFST